MAAYEARIPWYRSLALRLTALLLVIVIPLQLIGYMLYTAGSEAIRKRLDDEALSTLASMSDGVQNELQALYTNLINLNDDSTLAQAAYLSASMPAREYYQKIRELQTMLLNLRSNNRLISDVNVYLGKMEKVIGYGINRRWNDLEPESYGAFVEASRKQGNTSIVRMGDSLFVSLLMPSSCYYSDRMPNYAIQIVINETILRRLVGAYSDRAAAMYDGETDLMCLSERCELGESLFRMALEGWSAQSASTSGTYEFQSGATSYIAILLRDASANRTYLQLIPREEITGALAGYERLLLIFVIISFLVFCFCCFISLRTIQTPIKRLVDGFRRIEQEEYSVQVEALDRSGELTYLMHGFNRMASKLNDTVNRLYKQRLYAQRMELRQLQTQINPHFLYNSYFMLERMLAQGDSENAQALARNLGEYFKYINRNAREQVTLEEEWLHVSSYASVQQLRYERRMKITQQPLRDDVKTVMVPRLILQPIVENAIEHGLEHVVTNGRVDIRYERDVGLLRFVVEDNGGEVTDELIASLREALASADSPTREMTAIINIHRRLQLLYGDAYGLTLERTTQNGLRVTLCLPCEGGEGVPCE